MNVGVRRYINGDERACTRIYNHYVENTTVTFEEKPISTQEMINRTSNSTACFVCLLDGDIIGYAYAKNFFPIFRDALSVSIYTDHRIAIQGLGQLLYSSMITELAKEDYRTLIAIISISNARSIRFHERMGFNKVGHLHCVTSKLGITLDVGFWEKILH